LSKSVYALQPYYVGSKRGKSLAIIIPLNVVRKYNFNESTIFALRTDNSRNVITLEAITGLESGVGLGKTSVDPTFENKTLVPKNSHSGSAENGF
jgi:hypothetical protein